MYFEIIKLY